MNKIEYENHIFELSGGFLNSLYGGFKRDVTQNDKPDAAIILDGEEGSIGIEITTVDNYEDKQYFNDKKFSKDLEDESIDNCISGVVPERPIKSSSIPMEYNYIYKAIEGKARKYKSYKSGKKFKEVILLISSDYLDLNYKHFGSYLIPWTNHLLSKVKFPFEKVIFACGMTGGCVMIYDKNKPKLTSPKRDKNKELGVTHINSGFIPIGKSVNINKLFNAPPLTGKKTRKP
ncbi:hypothetical protein [Dickeya fangzhongdai]|uniref:hypothetical protein n=2 Tax=Pectobacteriaceae TaxID=1903410 RepID=UPI000537C6D9|nr:hypothetical protein [Dickeya fangzhongdai]KGT97554.1 hypothetical protein NM75_14485 [Dickeya fangzhongdai]